MMITIFDLAAAALTMYSLSTRSWFCTTSPLPTSDAISEVMIAVAGARPSDIKALIRFARRSTPCASSR